MRNVLVNDLEETSVPPQSDVVTDDEMLVILSKIIRDSLNKPADRMTAFDYVLKLQDRENNHNCTPVTIFDIS